MAEGRRAEASVFARSSITTPPLALAARAALLTRAILSPRWARRGPWLVAVSLLLGGCAGGGQYAYRTGATSAASPPTEARSDSDGDGIVDTQRSESDEEFASSKKDVGDKQLQAESVTLSTSPRMRNDSQRDARRHEVAPPAPMAPMGAMGGMGGAVGNGSRGPAAPPPKPQDPARPEPAKPTTTPVTPGSGTTLGAGSTPVEGPQKANAPLLIYEAKFRMAVFRTEAVLTSIEAMAKEMGGYLVTRTADVIVVRVPKDRFNDAIGTVEKSGDVLTRKVSSQDVTDEYLDLEIRMKNARAVRDRLQELLAKSNNIQDSLAIERELQRVTEQLELIEGRLKGIRDRVAFSKIEVSVQPRATESLQKHTVQLPFPWMSGLGLSRLLELRE